MLLPGSAVVGDLDTNRADVVQALGDLYAYPTPVPASGWVRANMVSTLDGSANGPDGGSGALGGSADRAVFGVLRGLADVILVGAGTARAEGYHRPAASPDFAERRAASGQRAAPALAVVTRSGRLSGADDLLAPDADTIVVTCACADVPSLRSRFGQRRVIVAGEQDVDPVLATAQLAARGMPRILLEGGPTLLGRFVAAARLDELCLSISPLLVAGDGPRIAHGDAPATAGPPLRVRPAHLVECDGLLLGRWLVRSS
jgi:riboflavin biosynthesis pyrimidine reductase